MHSSRTRLALIGATATLALSSGSPTFAQDTSVTPGAATTAPAATLDPTDTGYTVRIGFPSGNREATASSPADIWAQHQGLFDAVFKPATITLDYQPFLGAGPAINEALIGNSLDVANYADTAGVLGKTAGADTSLVAIDEPSTAAWLVVKDDSPIHSVADLKGKSVATIKATFPHRFLLAVLAANGLTPDDIQFTNLSLPDSEVALDAGQIDAAVTLGPNAPRLLARGYRAIASTTDLPAAAGISVFAATNPFLAAHPSFFPAYLAARDQAVAWATANPAAAYQVLADSLKLTVDQAKQLYPSFDFTSAITSAIVDRIKVTDQFLVDQGLAPTALDVPAWVSPVAGGIVTP